MRIGTRALWVVGTLGVPMGFLGCELALDFDRSRVDGGALVVTDATFSDAPRLGDALSPGADGPLGDDAQPEAGEAGSDVGTDSPVDTGSDAAADSADALDLGVDAADG